VDDSVGGWNGGGGGRVEEEEGLMGNKF